MSKLTQLPRVVVLGLVVAAVGEMYFAMLFPFFPGAAIEHGVSSTTTGVIFAIMAFGQLVAAPLAPLLRERLHVPAQTVLLSCAAASACLALAFGLTDAIADTTVFVACTATIRLCQGLVTSSLEVTLTGLVVRQLSTEGAAHANGLLMSCRGMAMLVGPVIGGTLYQLGGYATPFVFGGALFCCLGVALACSPRMADAPPAVGRGRSPSYLFGTSAGKMLSIAEFRTVMGFQCCIMLGISFLQPAWEEHLSVPPFDMSQAQVGGVLALGVFCMATGAAGGSAVVRRAGDLPVLLLGLAVMCVSLLLLGPSPLLLLPAATPSLALLLFAVGVNGAAVGLTVPSGTQLVLAALARSGFSKEEVSEPIGSIGRSITAVCPPSPPSPRPPLPIAAPHPPGPITTTACVRSTLGIPVHRPSAPSPTLLSLLPVRPPPSTI